IGGARVVFHLLVFLCFFFFFQAEDGIRDRNVTGVQTCALPISVYLLKGGKKLVSKTMTKKGFALLFAFMLLLSPMLSVFSSPVHAKENDNIATAQDSNMESDKSKSKSEVKDYENVRSNPIKENSDLEEGDLEIIEGDGTLTYNDDGSVTFGVTSFGKNKIIFNEVDEMKDGIFEADITPDTDLNRFGFIYRVQDASEYKYVGTGDQNNQYFSEIFGDVNSWTSMTKGVPLEADE